MRLRVAVLLSALSAVAGIVAPSPAGAAPRHNHHLTIAASPNPILAGQGVVIYGRLEGPANAGQTIRLYHHLADSGPGYALVGTTTTNSDGFYEFTREEQVVETNRSWFVTGPDGSHSRTVHERVAPLVSIAASTTNPDTNHRVVFTGQVTPNHAFERVYLQVKQDTGDDWRTLASSQLGADSRYAIAYRFRVPAVRELRVLFKRDARNIRGESDPVTVEVQQTQVPGFSISSSQPIAPAGSSVTISGVLDQAGTTTPEANVPVQLLGRRADQRRFTVLAAATTGSNGGYSFTQPSLSATTVYYVRTVPAKGAKTRHTALLFQGVQDVLTLAASSSSVQVGQPVTFTGSVTPVKADHPVYLQEQGKDGEWHNIQVQVTQSNGTYEFTWTPGAPGTFKLRARMFHDEHNIGAASAPVSVTASLPQPSSLPPAS